MLIKGKKLFFDKIYSNYLYFQRLQKIFTQNTLQIPSRLHKACLSGGVLC